MGRENRSFDIYQILRNRILEEYYKPGEDFPTNDVLLKEFQVSASTISFAVTTLIKDGLIVTFGSGRSKRKIRKLQERTTRHMGLLGAHKSSTPLNVLKVLIYTDSQKNQLPPVVLDIFDTPLLMYQYVQVSGDSIITISTSYIPQVVSLIDLMDDLNNSNSDLMASLRKYGVEVSKFQESLIVDMSTDEECSLFGLPPGNNLQVVRITRKVFDKKDRIVALSLLVDRADAFEFTYKMNISDSP